MIRSADDDSASEQSLATSAHPSEPEALGQLTSRLLDSFPHPAILVRRGGRDDRRIVAASSAAADTRGAAVGSFCWQTWGGSEAIPQAARDHLEAHGQPPAGGTKCCHCRLEEATPQSTHVVADGRILETHWVPIQEHLSLHYAVDVTASKQAAEELESKRKQFDALMQKRAQELEKEIAERKQAEEALRQSDQKTDAILDQASQLIGLLTPEGILLEVNRAALELGALQKEDVIGKLFWECPWWTHSPEQQQRVRDGVRRAAAGAHIRFEAHHPAPDGSVRYVDGSLEPVRNESGQVIYIVPEGRDITERKRAEEAVKTLLAGEALIARISAEFISLQPKRFDEGIRSALERIARHADTVRGSLFLLSEDGERVSNTHEWCACPEDSQIAQLQDVPVESFGYYMGLLQGGQNVVVGRWDDLPEEAVAERAWAEEQGFRPLLFVPMTRGNALRGAIGFYGSISEERDFEPSLVSLLRFAADVVMNLIERQRAEAERLALEAQVQQAQKLESLGILAGGVAHDFNNLLVGIVGNAELALQGLPPSSPVRSYLEELVKTANRAAGLTSQMLHYSGKGRFVLEDIDLRDQIHDLRELLNSSVSKKALIELDFAEDLPLISADVTQICQILMNLVINASEAIGEAQGRIRIGVEAGVCERSRCCRDEIPGATRRPAAPCVILEVADDGCGMDEATRAKMFEPFFTTKFTGRGLGMAAVYGIIRGHEAGIEVNSTLGHGTIVRIHFRAKGELAAAKQGAEQPTEHWRGAGTILLVDDEDVVREVASELLKELGFSVVTASDGVDAVVLFRERHGEIACVILDLTMPRMSGEEAYREIRKTSADVPVILSSGYGEQHSTRRFGEEGLAGFLRKPYQLTTLIDTLRTALASTSRPLS